jgi:hypothetical protein
MQFQRVPRMVVGVAWLWMMGADSIGFAGAASRWQEHDCELCTGTASAMTMGQ